MLREPERFAHRDAEPLDRLLRAPRIAGGRLKEWQPGREEEQSGREFTARARLVGHYAEQFGEAVQEYNPASPVTGCPGLIVVEHKPMPGRSIQRATSSLVPMRPSGSPMPDFYVGAHAVVGCMDLLTRDAARYRPYFPGLTIVAP